MKTIYHQPLDEDRPKRGDIVQTNAGDKRERTCIVLATHVMPTRFCDFLGYTAQRTKIWMARWWELEPEMRMALYKSAERAGGQTVFWFKRFPAKKKKPTFEQHMRRRDAVRIDI